MSATDFDVQLGELTRLKNEVFNDIEDIKALSKEADEAESIETKRGTLTKRAHYSINQMNDVLSVLELLILQFAPRTADQDLLWEKLALHKLTVRNLKEKLRNSQLEAYEQESERVHSQIVEEYVSKWKDSNLDSREQLFAGRSTPSEDKEDRPIEDQVLTQNKNITNSLKLTKQLMTMSVMQTELNTETLEQQTRDLSKVNDKLVDLESLLNKSRQIVKFIEKQDKKDKRRIYFSIGFLLLCLAWVIWHRILKLPVKVLTWSLLKVLGVVSWFTAKKEAPIMVDSYQSPAFQETTAISSSVSSAVHRAKDVVSSEVESISSSILDPILSESTESPRSEVEESSDLSHAAETLGKIDHNEEETSIAHGIETDTISTQIPSPSSGSTSILTEEEAEGTNEIEEAKETVPLKSTEAIDSPVSVEPIESAEFQQAEPEPVEPVDPRESAEFEPVDPVQQVEPIEPAESVLDSTLVNTKTGEGSEKTDSVELEKSKEAPRDVSAGHEEVTTVKEEAVTVPAEEGTESLNLDEEDWAKLGFKEWSAHEHAHDEL
ncbi:hypothetical protein FT663_00791 [Candidozyma haemuli var. vulneris]|uniref:Sec20 C-terminal domain-containing protein n=1 Tax=Candidozyma haemuli TaxID=45357 RepID=A0A2V1AZE0_9ASCO|nr:hypothetical protein CXQ85_005276 [[Candida] haemuloni]KAF3992881.1 hypothetical protein FT662_00883 [[Candida] haemuloni var. vulneris]KAF3995092.1 hypothetical protein FT663_00791 [[Candida] haemuloni var. vulneris]PVH22251.1 hypothetical protein CXQ85_005276 [[Candida] haemuloni]